MIRVGLSRSAGWLLGRAHGPAASRQRFARPSERVGEIALPRARSHRAARQGGVGDERGMRLRAGPGSAGSWARLLPVGRQSMSCAHGDEASRPALELGPQEYETIHIGSTVRASQRLLWAKVTRVRMQAPMPWTLCGARRAPAAVRTCSEAADVQIPSGVGPRSGSTQHRRRDS
jgi:hypothetical protein